MFIVSCFLFTVQNYSGLQRTPVDGLQIIYPQLQTLFYMFLIQRSCFKRTRKISSLKYSSTHMAIQTLFSHNPAPGIVKEISAMCHSREGKIRKK